MAGDWLYIFRNSGVKECYIGVGLVEQWGGLNFRVVKWWSGGLDEWRSGAVVEWWSGGAAERWRGGMVEW